jgi:Predicted periplasmic solute-binding protein
MKAKNVVTPFVMTIIKVVIYILIIILLFNLGKKAYSFGYAVFNKHPMSSEPGLDVTVTIRTDASVYEIGETLMRRGLIEDAKVFYVQELLSQYHGEIVAGTYILNTSYDVDQILQILANDIELDTDENGEVIGESL